MDGGNVVGDWLVRLVHKVKSASVCEHNFLFGRFKDMLAIRC